MGLFKKIKAKARSNRGEADDMLLAQFLEEGWNDYFEQVKGMTEEEKTQIKADFEGTGLGEAMALEFEEGEPIAEDSKTSLKACIADCSEE